MYQAYKGMAVGLAIASAIVWVLVALSGCSTRSSPEYNWAAARQDLPTVFASLASRRHPVHRAVRAPERSPVVPRRRGSDAGNVLPFSRSPSRERTLEVQCDNCQARFIAWHGSEEDADTETIDVEKCGLSAATHPRKTTSRTRCCS